jgi:predicted nucleic acid-binding protein
MRAYPDTSFLYGFYLKQSNSAAAAKHAATMKEALSLTELLKYEFEQSLRFQVWRRNSGQSEGLTQVDADASIKQLETDLSSGVALIIPCDPVEIFRRADQLSKRHTIKEGYRSFDILHVATALHLGAKEFLTFDSRQGKLAAAEGLSAKPC